MRKLFNPLPVIILLFFVFAGCRKTEPLDADASGSLDLSAAGSSKPNIILILADDVGYETPNFTGGQSYPTPNLNTLAAGGTQFTQCHTAPLCSPTRFMLLTAKYNFRNYTTWGTMDTSQRTIANLLKGNGYSTCAVGKWQFDGGDASIKKFGFDKYLVSNPFNEDEDSPASSFYKSPSLYKEGAFLPADSVAGKYGEDMVRDYMFDFIDKHKGNKPFFIYWAMNLVHKPFSPTPDDPQFATWNPARKPQPGDTVYYPSMVKYMDKLVGQLLTKLQTNNLQNKTLILFLGDNGSAPDIHSLYNGQVVTGAKSSSTAGGTHVPFVAYRPGKVLAGRTDTNLISVVDFMPTLAKQGKTSIPSSYGTTDGIDFSAQFNGDYTSVRPWIFCHFLGSGKNETNPSSLRRWMFNYTYKQYDSVTNQQFSKKFYNVKLDPMEDNAILPANRTTQEKQISQQFLNNMAQLH